MEVQFTPALEAKLASLAEHQGRDSAGLVIEAVERMVYYDNWFMAEVEKGLNEIESGQTLSHEEVGRGLEAYLAERQFQA